jgi:hypothetical protein
MDLLVSPTSYELAFEAICCFFTLIAVLASSLLSLRV